MAIDKIVAEYDLKLTQFEKDIKTIQKGLDKTEKEVEKTTKKQSQAFNKLGSTIVAAFSVQAIISFQKEIIKTTAEFQKFESVLSNTLGSNSAAQRAMAQIVDFAAKTPFQVNELTSAFVKLANQGFKPTMQQMRQLGDVAASTGKTFDQLAEAVIDAQVGEFERLKEFGIRAQKQGDQVKFTFKEVETQVDFTASSIRDYVLSLGDAQGVSGSMSKISETLGGKISMLGDAFDQLKLAIGEGQNGGAGSLIDSMTILTEKMTSLVKGGDEGESVFKQLFGLFQIGIGNINSGVGQLTQGLGEQADAVDNTNQLWEEFADIQQKALDIGITQYYLDAAQSIQENNAVVKDGLLDAIEFLQSEIDLKTAEIKANDKLIEQEKKLAELRDGRGSVITGGTESPKIKQLRNDKKLEVDITQETSDKLTEIVAETNRQQLLEDKALAQAKIANNLEVANSLATIFTAFAGDSKAMALFQLALSTGTSIANITEAATKAGAAAGPAAPIVTPAVFAQLLGVIAPSLLQARQIINSPLPTFFEGTDSLTASQAMVDLGTNKDSYVIRAHENERIMPALMNKKIGLNRSNSEVVKAVEFYDAFKSGTGHNMAAALGFGMDYSKLDKMHKKGALTVASEVRELRKDITSRKQDKFFTWQ